MFNNPWGERNERGLKAAMSAKGVVLLCANGAGKSTLMKAMLGLHRPAQGRIHLEGFDLKNMGAEQIEAQGLVLVPEGRQVFPELSVLDSIRLGAFLQRGERDARRGAAAALPQVA